MFSFIFSCCTLFLLPCPSHLFIFFRFCSLWPSPHPHQFLFLFSNWFSYLQATCSVRCPKSLSKLQSLAMQTAKSSLFLRHLYRSWWRKVGHEFLDSLNDGSCNWRTFLFSRCCLWNNRRFGDFGRLWHSYWRWWHFIAFLWSKGNAIHPLRPRHRRRIPVQLSNSGKKKIFFIPYFHCSKSVRFDFVQLNPRETAPSTSTAGIRQLGAEELGTTSSNSIPDDFSNGNASSTSAQPNCPDDSVQLQQDGNGPAESSERTADPSHLSSQFAYIFSASVMLPFRPVFISLKS